MSEPINVDEAVLKMADELGTHLFKAMLEWHKSKKIDPNGFYVAEAIGMLWYGVCGALPKDAQGALLARFRNYVDKEFHQPQKTAQPDAHDVPDPPDVVIAMAGEKCRVGETVEEVKARSRRLVSRSAAACHWLNSEEKIELERCLMSLHPEFSGWLHDARLRGVDVGTTRANGVMLLSNMLEELVRNVCADVSKRAETAKFLNRLILKNVTG